MTGSAVPVHSRWTLQSFLLLSGEMKSSIWGGGLGERIGRGWRAKARDTLVARTVV